MLALALAVKPDHVTLVPERREERTTEGGLDVVGLRETVERVTGRLQAAGVRVSLFIAADDAQIDASYGLGVDQVELHTGDYANTTGVARAEELSVLRRGAARAHAHGIRVAAGHGLTAANVGPVAALRDVVELNIGHAIVADAVFVGLGRAVRSMRRAMAKGRRIGG